MKLNADYGRPLLNLFRNRGLVVCMISNDDSIIYIMTPWTFRTHKIRWRWSWTLTTANPCSTSSRTGDFPPHDFARWVYIMYSDSVSLSCLSSGGDGGERCLRQVIAQPFPEQGNFRPHDLIRWVYLYSESVSLSPQQQQMELENCGKSQLHFLKNMTFFPLMISYGESIDV